MKKIIAVLLLSLFLSTGAAAQEVKPKKSKVRRIFGKIGKVVLFPVRAAASVAVYLLVDSKTPKY